MKKLQLRRIPSLLVVNVCWSLDRLENVVYTYKLLEVSAMFQAKGSYKFDWLQSAGFRTGFHWAANCCIKSDDDKLEIEQSKMLRNVSGTPYWWFYRPDRQIVSPTVL